MSYLMKDSTEHKYTVRRTLTGNYDRRINSSNSLRIPIIKNVMLVSFEKLINYYYTMIFMFSICL